MPQSLSPVLTSPHTAHQTSTNSPKLWRLHIRTASKNDHDHTKVVNYCIENKVAGIGWGIDSADTLTVDGYASAAREKYKKNVSSIAFASKVAINDLIWARGKNGVYYLGRITGDWQYVRTSPSVELDIPNQRACDWHEIGSEENVPGKIIACFRPPYAFQNIVGQRMLAHSMWLYNKKSDLPFYPNIQDIGVSKSADAFFEHIDDQDCEDVVGLFLQFKHGYLIVPSTCKKDTAGYEFVLMHPGGSHAVVQVKQGNIRLENKWLGQEAKVFLFSTQGGERQSNADDRVVYLDKEELFSFVKENHQVMPSKILYWLNEEYR